ncbi:MAG: hypothetical protein WD688_24570 [Candidatus Binatia bacterium]
MEQYRKAFIYRFWQETKPWFTPKSKLWVTISLAVIGFGLRWFSAGRSEAISWFWFVIAPVLVLLVMVCLINLFRTSSLLHKKAEDDHSKEIAQAKEEIYRLQNAVDELQALIAPKLDILFEDQPKYVIVDMNPLNGISHRTFRIGVKNRSMISIDATLQLTEISPDHERFHSLEMEDMTFSHLRLPKEFCSFNLAPQDERLIEIVSKRDGQDYSTKIRLHLPAPDVMAQGSYVFKLCATGSNTPPCVKHFQVSIDNGHLKFELIRSRPSVVR